MLARRPLRPGGSLRPGRPGRPLRAAAPGERHFVGEASESGTLVGSTRYGNIDRSNRRVEIGWTWIARSHQRTAVNTEAKYLMLRHAFEQMNARRVMLKTDETNVKSRAAIARTGH